jgi:transcriptional regulator of acetoin/glycerol metabolism
VGATSSVIDARIWISPPIPNVKAGGLSNLILQELERHYILQVLNEDGSHVDLAAQQLDLSLSTLYQRLKIFGPELSGFWISDPQLILDGFQRVIEESLLIY